ncbi:MAG: serine/threonine protein kinase [Myxococcales bacterium]|nr:serine/threonine protein kinase [Myxococcales bacterium]
MLDWGSDPRVPEQIPEILGRYEILLPIASGGVATVYLASSTGAVGFERDVAIKLTHRHLRDSPEFFTQLVDEARLAGKIHHPNVVSVHDVGLADRSAFIVMDYVEGDSLAAVQQLLKHQGTRMPLGIALKILDDVLAGLHAAHDLRGDDGSLLHLVHRDVTPHNILVGTNGAARLTDFGVAKARARLTKTMPGFVKGKIAYMSPEQAQGKGIDRTVDVWAAGVVAWELMSGTRLHDGTNDPVVMMRIAREPPMRLRHVSPEVPRELDAVLARALSMDPRSRPPSAEALAEALRAASDAAGVGRADAREVKDFLLGLVGPELEARREKVAKIRALRRRVVDLGAQPFERRSLGTPPPTRATATVASVPLAEQLEPPAPHRGTPVSTREPGVGTGPRRFAKMNTVLAKLLTAPLVSRAWVVVSVMPAVSLALGYVVAETQPSGTRVISSGPLVSGSAPTPARSVVAPAVPPSAAPERVLTPADLAVAPAADADAAAPLPLPSDGVITPFELGVEPSGTATPPGARPKRR